MVITLLVISPLESQHRSYHRYPRYHPTTIAIISARYHFLSGASLGLIGVSSPSLICNILEWLAHQNQQVLLLHPGQSLQVEHHLSLREAMYWRMLSLPI